VSGEERDGETGQRIFSFTPRPNRNEHSLY
jgi:hypothetical protein